VSFTEVDLFGVYVAPIVPMMAAAWGIVASLRAMALRSGALEHVWHPALVTFGVYVTVLSMIVLLVR
jgi:hypothetical protein